MLIMKKYILLFILLPLSTLVAQSTKGRWADLFSYADVRFIEEIDQALYCATENGIFLYETSGVQDEWIKYNKTNILSNVGITAMAFDANESILLIGYESGAMDLLINGEAQMVLDIPWNIFSGSKKINDISIQGDIAIIAGQFGIASYSLSQKEFLETTFFYDSGNYKAVNKVVFFNDRIYAATDSGIYHYPLVNGTNFPNFYVWEVLTGSAGAQVKHLEVFNNELYYTYWSDLYKRSASEQVNYIGVFTDLMDLKATNEGLVIAQKNRVNFMNPSGQITTKNIRYRDESGAELTMEFNTGYIHQNKFYGGSTRFGLIDFDLSAQYYQDPQGYKPDGPYNNKSVGLAVKNQKVWIAPGGANYFNEPTSNSDGFYYFDKFQWKHFKSAEMYNAKDFIRITVDPKDDNHFVAVPYFEATSWSYNNRIGVMEFHLEDNTYSLNHIVSPLEWMFRSASASFDENGNLYLGTSWPQINGAYNDRANYYYERKGNTWKKSLVYKNSASNALSPEFSSNYIWYPNARAGGLTVLDKNMNEVATLTKANAELYDDAVLSVAIDQNNTVWIGTQLGITVLSGGDTAIETGNLRTQPIVIIQDGIPEALLTSIRVNDIKVDKANRKWIATHTSGAYYVSDNGEQTIYHFTSKNSPLPSDIINDIEIDDTNGKVYFATDKGVVVFNGDVQDVGDNFDQVIAYPNPVRPGFKGKVIIKNIPNRASVKITDVTGNLIYEAKANGGIVEWDTKNSKGKDVASGVYLVLMTNADGTETKTIKIAVVR